MLKTTTIWSHKNLPLDMIKNTKIDNRISSITRSAKNLLTSMDMAKDAEFDGNNHGADDKMVKTSPFSRKSNAFMGYLNSLYCNANSILFEKI